MFDNEHFLLYEYEHSVYVSEQYSCTEKCVNKESRILIIDDDQDILVAAKLLLKRHFGEVVICNAPVNIPKLFASTPFDVVLLDMNFGPGESTGADGFQWLNKILQLDPEAVVIMITAHGGVDVAVEAMKQGATDFIAKPWQNEKVIATLSAAMKLRESRSQVKELKDTNKVLSQVSVNPASQMMLGNSASMAQVKSLIERSAATDANVLILGENGTGKELVARELHTKSLRSEAVFMSVDLGSISDSLFESELFGHKKGAFTGAKDDRVGRLKAADAGTLFLDEIGNLPLHLQSKLLTVLEQRVVTPLGSNTPIPFDARVIAATNLPRSKLMDETVFRQDLLFRLNTVEIQLPPLSGRTEDIIPIAEHYIQLYCRKYNKPVKTLEETTAKALLAYPWPGNVRALRHAIERAVILSEGNTLSEHDFQLSADIPKVPAQETSNSVAMPSTDTSQSLNLEALEKQAIRQALQQHLYNISHAAKALGVTRAALYRRMEKYGL